MEAIAKYDFKATADDELSFKRGDILKVSADVVSSPHPGDKEAVLALPWGISLTFAARFDWTACSRWGVDC